MSATEADANRPRDGFPRPVPDGPTNVMEQFSMKGKVTVVNGASDGIGYAVAEAMAEAGGDVALWYNTNDAAVQKAEHLTKTCGVKAKAYQVDVTDAAAVEKAVADVANDFGRMDVMIANAGMGNSKGLLDMSLDEYKKMMAVNVDGVVHCAKYAGALFKSQSSGNLIITSSMSAHIVNIPTDQPVYNATKAFVTHLGKSLAREWRDFARVNIVSPGFFDTKMGPGSSAVENEAYRMSVLGRLGDVKEIKGLYLYLASSASSYTTGSDVLIDGGYVLP
ncbi:enoyl-(Acyl carrier protein) reductase domain-containing protein [Sarocladium implicatum]|nr:enoyl-(Acyl carrier protein) reductase domain-containing protein [Sarocladium implicatum]